MRTQSKAAAVALDAYFETPSNYAHAANLAGQPATDLVLERLPSGELAWLRSEDRGEPDDGSHYYHHWLAALERLVMAKGLTDRGALETRKQAWADAYRHTPHGKPVELAAALIDRTGP